MAGGSHPKSSFQKPPSSSSSATAASSHRKSRWESPKKLPSDQKPNPSSNQPSPALPKTQPDPAHAPFPSPGPPFPFSEPPPPPAYGFHMLDRRTIVLVDGSVRSYFALPPDYDFTPRHNSFLRPEFDGRFAPQFSPETAGFRDWNKPIGAPENGSRPMKRKYGADGEMERQHYMAYPNQNRDRLPGTNGPFDEEGRAAKYIRTGDGSGGGQSAVVKHKYDEVDRSALKKAFLHFVKVVNENVGQRKSYLENGKQGRLQCVACRRFDQYEPNVIV